MSPPRRRKAPDAAERAPAAASPQRDFWGSDDAGEEPVELIRPADDPTVDDPLARARRRCPGARRSPCTTSPPSPRRPPSLAVALAAASGLLDMDDSTTTNEDDFEPA